MNHSLLHRLAQLTPGEPPILSIYLDLHLEGERPEVHPDLVHLRSRLHAIEQTLWPRGPQFDDFQADVAQVEQFLQD